MEPTITQMLDEEYKATLEALSNAEAGSDEAKWQLQKLSELHKQRMNEEKAYNDSLTQTTELSLKQKEHTMKTEQIEEAKKDRFNNNMLEWAAILVPAGCSCYWMAKGLKFEETGTFTSRVGQWLGNHLRLFKK